MIRIYNSKGDFDLPDGFSISIERTNPFLTDEGDTSIPVTLPPTPNNLRLLGHIERIDADDVSMMMADAWLSTGAVSVKGTLIVDTLNRNEGIDAAFTFRNGGLYATQKEKTLKDLFASYDGGNGYKVSYDSASEAAKNLSMIYAGTAEAGDFTCFPVLGQAEENYDIGHFIINGVYGQGLISEARTCYEGGALLQVPEGYGITPFIYLDRLIDLMFEMMGYTVTYNTFAHLTHRIVVLNNCVDAIVNGEVCYSDMAPDMTVSDFLNWLRDRFMVQAVADSSTMTVNVLKFDEIAYDFDVDISDRLTSQITMRYECPAHCVITPTVGEGAEAAAPTLKALKEKYGAWAVLNERQYMSIVSSNFPAFADCLVQRRSTGIFYELQRDVNTGKTVMVSIGSNYFAYDRENAENADAFGPADVIPLMVCTSKRELYPVVGDHIHNHSTYDGMSKNHDQPLMIVQEYVSGAYQAAFNRCGTTQGYVPLTDLEAITFDMGLTPEMCYSKFWSTYNNILLNGKRTATMAVEHGVSGFFMTDMTRCKCCLNQKLLPVRMAAEIGERTRSGESEFIVVPQRFAVTDRSITPDTPARLRWVMNNSQVADFRRQCLVTPKYYDRSWNEVPQENCYWFGGNIPEGSVRVTVGASYANVWLGPPTEAGLQVLIPVTVTVSGRIFCTHMSAQSTPWGTGGEFESHEFSYTSGANQIYLTFTSVTY